MKSKQTSQFDVVVLKPRPLIVSAGRQQPIACRSKIAATNFYI